MADNLSLILGIVLSLLSLFTGFAGALAWYSSRVKKQYAAERDFGHLKRNYEQLSQNLKELWRQNDERFDAVDRGLDRICAQISLHEKAMEAHRLGKPSE